MELTQRQEKILQSLIKEYIDQATPVSSKLLQKKCRLDISGATIRNELQTLDQQGYVSQPHTSAGRVPTPKAYRYFVQITFTREDPKVAHFILKEVETARQKIDRELELAKELTESLAELSHMLSFNRMEEHMLFNVLKIIGPSQATYDKNIDTMKELLEKLESF